jgi:hypothetical protein
MDQIDFAVECTKAVAEVKSRDIQSRYASRARSLISDLYVLGPAYVVAVAAARSSKDAVELGLRAESCREVVEGVMNAREGPEWKAYALYGAVLLYTMKKVGVVSSTSFEDVLVELKRPSSALKSREVARWIKLLAEAYFK